MFFNILARILHSMEAFEPLRSNLVDHCRAHSGWRDGNYIPEPLAVGEKTGYSGMFLIYIYIYAEGMYFSPNGRINIRYINSPKHIDQLFHLDQMYYPTCLVQVLRSYVLFTP
jgi:hypothetical protein